MAQNRIDFEKRTTEIFDTIFPIRVKSAFGESVPELSVLEKKENLWDIVKDSFPTIDALVFFMKTRGIDWIEICKENWKQATAIAQKDYYAALIEDAFDTKTSENRSLEERELLTEVLRRKAKEAFGDKVTRLERANLPKYIPIVIRQDFNNDKELWEFMAENDIVWKDLCEEAEQEVAEILSHNVSAV